MGHPQREVLNAVKDSLDLVPQLLRAAQSPGAGNNWELH